MLPFTSSRREYRFPRRTAFIFWGSIAVILIWLFFQYLVASRNSIALNHDKYRYFHTPTAEADAADASESLSAPPNQFPSLSRSTSLIIVAGHSVLKSLSVDETSVTSPASWYLTADQTFELPTFISHIRRGVSELSADDTSMLLFSGGVTRFEAGPYAEGESYYRAARAMNWFGFPAAVESRIFTEVSARDSFENVLFSLCRFRDLTGRYPTHLTIIGFEFKRHRFESLHRAALKWPADKFRYIGIDPSGPEFDIDKARSGEKKFAVDVWKSEPFGCDPALIKKRESRNPFMLPIGYGFGSSCPELFDLIHYCGPEEFNQPLPWD